jgi:hypothetical protein
MPVAIAFFVLEHVVKDLHGIKFQSTMQASQFHLLPIDIQHFITSIALLTGQLRHVETSMDYI